MKDRLQAHLQALVATHLPGFRVECRYSSNQRIDVYLMAPKTKESMRIAGLSLRSLIDPGTLEIVAEELLFEILAVARPVTTQRTPPDDSA